MRHRVYSSIVRAVLTGKLKEPFTVEDFKKACPSFAEATYRSFLHNHTKNNPGGNSEVFERVTLGKFVCMRLLKYGPGKSALF